MSFIEGDLISGIFDRNQNVFSIQKVKHFEIQSILDENLTNHLYRYLKLNEQEEEGIILTLYDQLPIMITKNEIGQFLNDLERVKGFFC